MTYVSMRVQYFILLFVYSIKVVQTRIQQRSRDVIIFIRYVYYSIRKRTTYRFTFHYVRFFSTRYNISVRRKMISRPARRYSLHVCFFLPPTVQQFNNSTRCTHKYRVTESINRRGAEQSSCKKSGFDNETSYTTKRNVRRRTKTPDNYRCKNNEYEYVLAGNRAGPRKS